jgi:hypothetical protein
MEKNIFDEIEKMTDAEKQALLNTQFPEELEKEAAAELDTSLLADALYSYGWLQAQRALADVDGLDKVAADDLKAHEQAEEEVAEQIEACLQSLGTHVNEDDAELHKEAQVCAALIFDGFSDCIEQGCMDKEAASAMAAKAGKMAMKGLHKMKAAGKKVGKKALGLAKKHGGKAALFGGGAAAAKLHSAMSKESGALTPEQLVEIASDVALEKQATITVIEDGINKLAAKGAHKGKKLKDMMKSSKSSASSASSKSSKSS